ncbi:hypothetical protein [Falsirhodobacter xinxiangensis]|uniref:hypothetical protein n=1 Tax=Falsirhodobacter xinxiangensis TaxID=2530049 RepID=UPI0010AA0A25|nr:hypothetical protein [Rhodobacter xinxiangensis]
MTDDTRTKRDQQRVRDLLDGNADKPDDTIALCTLGELRAILDAPPAQPVGEGDLCQFCHDAGASSCACLSGHPSAAPTDYQTRMLDGGLAVLKSAAPTDNTALAAAWYAGHQYRAAGGAAQDNPYSAAFSQPAAPQPTPEVEALKSKLRMIVSHATAGRTDGEGQSVNDICVQITALRNELWEDAQAALARGSVAEKGER